MLQQDGGEGEENQLFFNMIVSYVLSLIKIITISKKTLCDLEVRVLRAHTLGRVGAGNRQCLDYSVSEQPLVDGYPHIYMESEG